MYIFSFFVNYILGRQNEYSNQYMGHLPGSGQILSNVECQTTERRLIECNYKYPSTNCTHKMDAGVQCMDGGKKISCEVFFDDYIFLK